MKLATKSSWLGKPFTKRWERGLGYGINDKSVYHIICEHDLSGRLNRSIGQSYCGLNAEEMDTPIIAESLQYKVCKICFARQAAQNKRIHE